jgi:hypothetical protein
MNSRSGGVDYEALGRLLGALSESVADRMPATGTLMVAPTSIREAVVDARRQPAPVSVTALPRGVPVAVVLRAALSHFLPSAAAVAVPLYLLFQLGFWFDFVTNLRVFEVLSWSTAGFALGLLAMSRWLYPHSHPDGQRSDVAGLVSPVIGVFAAFGFPSLVPAVGGVPHWLPPLLSGAVIAVVTYAPWLRRTSRIASASGRHWVKLHAAVRTGGLVAAVFAYLSIVEPSSLASLPFPTAFAVHVAFRSSFGFIIGTAFAVALGVVYRRHALEDLKAWKAGLCAAAATLIPWLVMSIVTHTPPTISLGDWLTVQFPRRLLPGFLIGYGMVKLAQRSARKG